MQWANLKVLFLNQISIGLSKSKRSIKSSHRTPAPFSCEKPIIGWGLSNRLRNKCRFTSSKQNSRTAEELIRERIYAMALGDEEQDALDRLAHDPAMRMATWNRPGQEFLDQRLASQPTQSRLLDWLANAPGNRESLRYSLCNRTPLTASPPKFKNLGHSADS